MFLGEEYIRGHAQNEFLPTSISYSCQAHVYCRATALRIANRTISGGSAGEA